MNNKKNILVGIPGGIAAYKACELVSSLSKQGFQVRVVMSEHATHFVGTLTLAALSHHPVYTSEFEGENEEMIPHIELARWADAFVVVPATANFLAKAVTGIADDLLTSIVPACTCPKIMALAMNVHMYENPVTQHNMELASSFGWQLVQPEEGVLACQDTGKGRLASTSVIESALKEALETSASWLEGKTVLISAGPTQESLDPVRFLSNHSSGRQGYAIAKAAQKAGASTILVSGPCHLPVPDHVRCIPVTTALEMEEAMLSEAKNADFIIMAAAVADYRPASVSEQKIKKSSDQLHLELVRNPDILSQLGRQKKPGQILCGFAMETQNLDANARAKLESKNCDLLVANNLTTEGAGFQNDTNVVSMLFADHTEHLPLMQKEELGQRILKEMMNLSKGGK